MEEFDSNDGSKCTKNKHFRKRILHFQDILLKTKRSRVNGGKERNQQVNKRKINAVFNYRTDFWSLGVILYIGHTDNASKNIQSTTPAS